MYIFLWWNHKIVANFYINISRWNVFQERRREEEARKAQEILQRRRNREEEAEVNGRHAEMLVLSFSPCVAVMQVQHLASV